MHAAKLTCLGIGLTLAIGASPAHAAKPGPKKGYLGPELIWAIKTGNAAEAKALIARGADPNSRTSSNSPR